MAFKFTRLLNVSPNKLLSGNKDRIILLESPHKENLDPKITNKTQEWHTEVVTPLLSTQQMEKFHQIWV
jgi:hypothetical protein